MLCKGTPFKHKWWCFVCCSHWLQYTTSKCQYVHLLVIYQKKSSAHGHELFKIENYINSLLHFWNIQNCRVATCNLFRFAIIKSCLLTDCALIVASIYTLIYLVFVCSRISNSGLPTYAQSSLVWINISFIVTYSFHEHTNSTGIPPLRGKNYELRSS